MTPADVLRQASQTLLDLADETDEETKTNPYWASDEHPPHNYPNLYARGVDNALGGPAGRLAGLFTPDTARQLAAAFRAWARAGDLDPDVLHRIGGPETLAIARQINGRSQP